MNSPLFATIKEIAARYGMCSKTITKWVKTGVIPITRINKRVILFYIEACDQIFIGRMG